MDLRLRAATCVLRRIRVVLVGASVSASGAARIRTRRSPPAAIPRRRVDHTMSWPVGDDEAARLDALLHLDLLDVPTDEVRPRPPPPPARARARARALALPSRARFRRAAPMARVRASARQDFERITSLCASALGVPICLVSLVDARRQWFLSNRGLGDVKETGRELAFCGHAILPPRPGAEAKMFVVRDATADSRFKDTALVTGWPPGPTGA